MPGARLTLFGTLALIALLIAAFIYIGMGARDGGGDDSPSPAVAASAIQPAVVDLEPTSAILARTQAPIVLPGEPAPSVSARADAAPLADPTPPAAVAIPAVEIVETLTPSVARITTELVGADAFGAPIPPTGAGTGIVWDEDGHILTNSHVIEGAETISATLQDGEIYDASVVGADPATDLAIIKIAADADALSPAALGESSDLRAGEDVIAIGYVMGMPGAPSVSKGVVSAVGRHINNDRNFTLIDLIQTDAAINSGNSGGPLANSRAEVVGVNTAVARAVQGVGFAVSIDGAKEIARQLIANGFVRRGYVGVFPVTLNPLIASQLGLPDEDTEGVLIQRVLPDAPAADAGIQQWDIITALDGAPITNTGELSKFLMSRAPGDSVEIAILRDGDELAVTITLGARPDN